MSHPTQRLVARLLADEAVTDLVDDRVYPQHALQGASLPHIVYELVSDTPSNHVSGTTGTVETRLMITVSASSYTALVALSEAMQAALSGWRDAEGSVWHLDTISDLPFDPASGDDLSYAFQREQTYIVWWGS